MNSLTCAAWEIVFWVLRLFFFAMLAYALVSWVPSLQGRWSYYVARIVEPILQPVRRVIPPIGGFDLSFIVVLVFLQFVTGAVARTAYESSYCLIR